MRKRKREVGERKKGEKSGKKGKNGKKKRNQEQALEKRDRARSRWRMRKQEEMNIYRGARFLSMKEERKDLKSVESGTGMKRNFMGEEGGTGMKKLSSSSSSSSRFNRICVFCGSSSSKRASYKDVAIELGKELILRNIDLIYGGESIGLMGLVSDTVRTGGQHILGVIHKSLMSKEITGGIAGDVRVVSNMHERKAEMVRVVDAFIALPRGYGILQELFEVITWAQLGIHSMPVGVLNVDGYYDLNLSFIDSAVVEEFISSKTRCILISAPSPKELLKKLEKYVPERDEIVTQLNWDVEVLGSDVSGSDSEPGNQLFESSS